MNLYDVIGILAVILWVAFLVVSLYYKAKGNAVELIAQFIALAEQEAGKTGPEKMDMVALYDYIPAAFRTILSRETLREIAQRVFNWMRRYAVEYLESKKKPPDDGKVQEYTIPDADLSDDGK